jgi:hypothetical protein
LNKLARDHLHRKPTALPPESYASNCLATRNIGNHRNLDEQHRHHDATVVSCCHFPISIGNSQSKQNKTFCIHHTMAAPNDVQLDPAFCVLAGQDLVYQRAVSKLNGALSSIPPPAAVLNHVAGPGPTPETGAPIRSDHGRFVAIPSVPGQHGRGRDGRHHSLEECNEILQRFVNEARGQEVKSVDFSAAVSFVPDSYFQYLAITKQVALSTDHFSLSYSLNGLPHDTKARILHCVVAALICSNLMSLKLAGLVFPKFLEAIAPLLYQHGPHLQLLDFRDMEMGDAGIQRLCHYQEATGAKAISTLTVSGNKIGDAGADALGNSVKHLLRPKYLDLGRKYVYSSPFG